MWVMPGPLRVGFGWSTGSDGVFWWIGPVRGQQESLGDVSGLHVAPL
jgi:hypothetical protein